VRLRHLIAAVAAASLLTAACSIGSSPNASASNPGATINVGYYTDPTGGIDPAYFYSVQGESIILSVYEGLLKYTSSDTIAPSLAASYSESANGLTYTFAIRRGVHFHDGTLLNAQAVELSFQREIKAGQAPSYMLSDVASMSTPAPMTFRVRLNKPDAPFLSYLASMYGPKIISPLALREHAGPDDAHAWLESHEDGTGPYRLTVDQPGYEYVLARFSRYWGTPAKSRSIVITVNSDIGAQLLQLRSGQLDLIEHGVPPAQIASLRSDPDLQVVTFPALIRVAMALNLTKPPFTQLASRQAFASALGICPVVRRVYGSLGSCARSLYPDGMPGSSASPVSYPARPVPDALKSQTITIAYDASEPDLQDLAELFQLDLQKAGFHVSLRGDTIAEEFGYATDPKQAPNALITSLNPDSANPGTWIRPVFSTGGGLNGFGYSNPRLDSLISLAAVQTSVPASLRLYAEAGNIAAASDATLQLADLKDVFAASGDVSCFYHVPAYVAMVSFADLCKR
jgi:peptide/nickel transport system substrate-binding protein